MSLLKILRCLRRDLMYKQFCKNLHNFIKLNQSVPNIRLQLAQEILFLTDVHEYIRLKESQNIKSKQISSFINQLELYKEKYPSIGKFIWELWAYGFDIENDDEIKKESYQVLEEKAKLIDLLLSTQYLV